MKLAQDELIDQLEDRTKEILHIVNKTFVNLSEEKLFENSIPNKWSVAQCLEHLNLYGDFYLKEIECAINSSRKDNSDTMYRSGWLGNYFAESMLPKDKMKTMKTFKDKDTSQVQIPKNVLQRFKDQQEQLLLLLERCRRISLMNQKVPITIAPIVKIRLGDTFRFVINHNWRHVCQALKVAENQ